MSSPFQANPAKQESPNHDLTFTTPGGGVMTEAQRLPGIVHRWHIVKAKADELVSLNFVDESRVIQRLPGLSGIVSRGFTRLAVATDTPQTLIVSCGDEAERDSRAGTPGGGASLVTVNGGAGVSSGQVGQVIVGPVAYNTNDTINNFGPPVPTAMFRDNHDGSFTSFPLQTLDGKALTIAPGPNTVAGFVAAPPMNYPTPGVQVMRISIATADAAQPLLVSDQFGADLPVYCSDGSAVLDGSIPTGTANKSYYIPCAGCSSVVFTSAGGGWGFRFGTGPVPFIPRLG